MALVLTPMVIQINDEGASQGTASIIDFVGSSVAATVSSDTATITVTVDYPQVLFMQIFS